MCKSALKHKEQFRCKGNKIQKDCSKSNGAEKETKKTVGLSIFEHARKYSRSGLFVNTIKQYG